MAKRKSKSVSRKSSKSRKVVRRVSTPVASKKSTKVDNTAVVVVGIALLVLLAYYFLQ